MATVANAVAVPYACAPARGFLPDPDAVERLVTSRTKLLVINSPSNPTGAVFPRALIERLLAIAERHGLYVLSDECYDEMVFDGEHISPASFAGSDRVLSAFSFSKTYAMTGWRVGYMVSSPRIADLINKVHESNISCVSAIAQKAAEAALDGPMEAKRTMVESYRRRRDLCVQLLAQHDLLISRPGGAFYVMADIRRSGMASRDFAFALLRETGVAVAPGSAFGTHAADAVRISLASSEADLTEGIERLAGFVRRGGR
jgi:aspartate/methionine/tyrosine aminotransferase